MLNKFLCTGLLACAPFMAQASNLPDYPFIHVSGASATYAMPDSGQIDFEIAAHDADPAVALGIVEARANEIRALAKEQGVAAEDLELRDVRKDVRKPDANAAPGAVIYEIRIGARITVRDLVKWPAIAGPLVAKSNLEGFLTTFDSSQREKVETGLMNDAIKNARVKAQNIATGLGRQLGVAAAVTAGDLKNLTRAMGLAPNESSYREPRRQGLDRSDVMVVGLLKFGQSVDIIYRMK